MKLPWNLTRPRTEGSQLATHPQRTADKNAATPAGSGEGHLQEQQTTQQRPILPKQVADQGGVKSWDSDDSAVALATGDVERFLSDYVSQPAPFLNFEERLNAIRNETYRRQHEGYMEIEGDLDKGNE
jgi:hypothetical protein